MDLDRFVSLVWYWVTKDAEDDNAVRKFETRLWRPPVGFVPTTGPWSPEEETSAFKALKGAMG